MNGLAEAIKLGQKCLEAVPVVVLGSGASAAHGIRGMRALAEYLIESVDPAKGDKRPWERFKTALVECRDLENALQKVPMPDTLIATIVDHTRSMIVDDECKIFDKLVTTLAPLPHLRLFSHLLRTTHSTVSVVTTNYDRLAEFAAEMGRFDCYTGFTSGSYRYFAVNTHDTRAQRSRKTVEVWKVHGSTDWFQCPTAGAIGLPYSRDYPADVRPLLVTPGVHKYQRTHDDPFRTIMAKADNALSRANAFLCVGYGFNDLHIEPKLKERVRLHGVPVVVLARTLTASARMFVRSCTSRFLAVERAENNASRVFYQDARDGIEVDGDLWSLDGFLRSTTQDD